MTLTTHLLNEVTRYTAMREEGGKRPRESPRGNRGHPPEKRRTPELRGMATFHALQSNGNIVLSKGKGSEGESLRNLPGFPRRGGEG